jgi:hypothetical protein
MAAFANLRHAMFIYSESSSRMYVCIFRTHPRYTAKQSSFFPLLIIPALFQRAPGVADRASASFLSALSPQRTWCSKHATRHSAVSQKAHYNIENASFLFGNIVYFLLYLY